VFGRLVQSPRLRAVARKVPGLSRAFWGTRARLMRRRGVARLDYPKAVIRVHVDNLEIVRLRLRVVEKEPWTVEWLERELREDDTLYDVGANVGAYSLVAAALCPRSAVVAIEPGPANYEALCRNLVLNGMIDTVVPLPVGLAAETHLASLGLTDALAGAADHVLDERREGGNVPVLAYALDDLVEAFRLPPPTLLKIDVDGTEDAVLAGASASLDNPGLRSLIVEVDVAKTVPVREILARHGFSEVLRVDQRLGEPLPGIWYGVFERST
jgi:FkbM family methyltransferase